MKKTLSTMLIWVLIVIMLIPTFAFAEDKEAPDFAAMTDEELHDLINGARNELKSRELAAAEDTALIDQDGVKVYLTGKYDVEKYSETANLKLEAVVINDTDKMISILFDSASVNGWDVDNSGIVEITAGHKKKGEIYLTISDAEIEENEKIEDVVFDLFVYDCDNWDKIFDVDPLTVHFN